MVLLGFWCVARSFGGRFDRGSRHTALYRHVVHELDAEEIRLFVLNVASRRRAENAPLMNDPKWSVGAYNPARWIDRGFSRVLESLDRARPRAAEERNDYVRRLRSVLSEVAAEFGREPEDRDGGAASAVKEILEELRKFAS